MLLRYLKFDRFSTLLLIMVGLAVLMPVHGQAASALGIVANVAIALLFFLHGLKLAPQAVWQGIRHWQLHAVILSLTFVFFPLIGLVLRPVFEPLLGPSLYYGVIFLCLLPSTVQSSIAFTSMAKGNVAAAVCSASFSNIMGMFITPIFVALLILSQQQIHLPSHTQIPFDATQAIVKISTMLLLPFVIGQLLRPWLFPFLQSAPMLIKFFDQGSILLVVYSAFSAAVVAGLWSLLSASTLLILLGLCILILSVMMLLAWHLPGYLGFDRADQIAIFFCGSKKTLASGIPMAQVLFLGQPLGLILLPLMLFHQIQLMVCAYFANKWSQSS